MAFLTFFMPGYNDELGWVRTAGGVFRDRKGDLGWCVWSRSSVGLSTVSDLCETKNIKNGHCLD